jgi:Xaa-Pro aminopeptidase
MAIMEEIKEKERRVRDFLESRGLAALLLKRQANFSWLTAGSLNLVGITTEFGAASLLVTGREKFVLTSNIEAPRIMEEEGLEKQGFRLRSHPWQEEGEAGLVKAIVGEGGLGADVPFGDATVLTAEIARLRYSLTPEEQERYRWLGERASLALEQTLQEVAPGWKESEVVARLCGKLWPDRIDPITLMCAADERIFRYRHPIPTERRVEKYLMVSVNARKWGLIVSFTRFVHFGPLPGELRKRYEDNVRLDCAFMARTRPGAEAREILRRGIDSYRELGYPEEWKNHHQGGAIGYAGRDYRTSPDTPDIVQENQAFTWNPSLTGTKSEDTILARAGGIEMITRPLAYPTMALTVEGIDFIRPAILER